jgi:hypothetical protein
VRKNDPLDLHNLGHFFNDNFLHRDLDDLNDLFGAGSGAAVTLPVAVPSSMES